MLEAVKAERLIRISSGVSMPNERHYASHRQTRFAARRNRTLFIQHRIQQMQHYPENPYPGLVCQADTKTTWSNRIKPQTVSLLLTEKERGGIQLNFGVCQV